MFLYVLYGGLAAIVVCRIPRKCGLVEDFRFSLLTFGWFGGIMVWKRLRPYDARGSRTNLNKISKIYMLITCA
jgi:hypothetical protein